MQIYVSPYRHSIHTNLPYPKEKQRSDGNQNLGFLNVKKYPNKIKNIPELKNNPELFEFVEKINKKSCFGTFGCDINWNPLLEFTGYNEFYSWVNLYFADDLEKNKHEQNYLNCIGNFFKWKNKLQDELITVEFVLNPTNIHDFEKIEKGASPSEKTHVFTGWTLNVTVKAISGDPMKSVENWGRGLKNVQDFFVESGEEL